jgi:hypothetical protein
MLGIHYSYSVLLFLGWEQNHSDWCETDISLYSTMSKVKHSSYATGFKLKVIEYIEKHGNSAASCEFTMSELNSCYWRKEKDAPLQTTNNSRKAFWGPKSEKFPELEDKIFEYVRGLCNNGVGVSHKMLHFKSHQIEARQVISPSQLKVNRGWMYCFMKRRGLPLRRWTALSQKILMRRL